MAVVVSLCAAVSQQNSQAPMMLLGMILLILTFPEEDWQLDLPAKAVH
jgi:hypothetical protein